jgi:hypothetical protein
MGRWLVSWLPSDVYVHVRAAQPHVQEMQCNACAQPHPSVREQAGSHTHRVAQGQA